MTETPSQPPKPVRRALVFFLTVSEREHLDLIMNGEPQRLAGLQNGALNVTRAFINAGLMKLCGDDEDTYVVEPFVGFKIVPIEARGVYRLPKPRYDAVRHVQAQFKPDPNVEFQRESKEQLQQFLNDWAEAQGLMANSFSVGAWIMCGKLNTNPTSGSGLVYFFHGDPMYYVTIPGLEAFKLEASEKERTRSPTNRRPSPDGNDELIAPIQARLEKLKAEEQRLKNERETMQTKLDENKAKLDANAAEQLKVETAINALRG